MATKKELKEKIMRFDVNSIHNACAHLGHPTDWEYFDEELKTYTEKTDLEDLLEELEENEEI